MGLNHCRASSWSGCEAESGDPRTSMYFADAKKGLAELAAAVKTLVG